MTLCREEIRRCCDAFASSSLRPRAGTDVLRGQSFIENEVPLSSSPAPCVSDIVSSTPSIGWGCIASQVCVEWR